jgi:hypothetical protein
LTPGKEAPLPIENEADWAPELLVWTFFPKIKFNEKSVAMKHEISTLSVLMRLFCSSHCLAEEFAATFQTSMLHSSTGRLHLFHVAATAINYCIQITASHSLSDTHRETND